MTRNPLILVTNDDGIFAPGLHRLVECLPSDAIVYIVAPDAPHSGQSSAITVNTPLTITPHADFSSDRCNAFSVNGTPVDCVKLAMHTILPTTPDIIVSGINHGSNAGSSIIYSGTMGAILEACSLGLPAAGFSLLDHSMQADFTPALPYITHIIATVLHSGLPHRVCLNVNFPKGNIHGIKTVAAAKSHWTDEYALYTDPHGRRFYFLTGDLINEEPENPGTDLYWLEKGYASVVPATPDQTRFDTIPVIAETLGEFKRD